MKSIKRIFAFLFMWFMFVSIGYSLSYEDQQKLNKEAQYFQEQAVQINGEKRMPLEHAHLLNQKKVTPEQEKIDYYINRYGYIPSPNYSSNQSNRDCAAGDPEYTWTCGGGSFDSEISWSLSDGSSGIAGSGTICLADGDYTLTMIDSWGDGWNGGTWALADADGNAVASCGLSTGLEGTCEITLGGAPPVAGCTDPTSDQYNADATLDDGSCSTWNGGCSFPTNSMCRFCN